MIKLIKQVLIFSFLFFFISPCLSQNISIVTIHTTAKILYNIEQEKYKTENNYLFPVSNNERLAIPLPIKKGKLSFSDAGMENKESYWKKKFPIPLKIKPDSTTIQLVVYTENIKSYILYISCTKHPIFKKEVEIKNDGYQNPEIIEFNSFKYDQNSNIFSQNHLTINEIILVIKPVSKNYKYIISEFRIFQIELKEKEAYNPFFDKLTGNNTFNKIQKNSLDYSNSEYMLIGASYRHLNSGDYYIKPNNKNYDKKNLITNVFNKIFDYYPNYNHIELEKNNVLKRLQELKNPSISYEVFLSSINKMVMEFRDPHFFISSLPGKPKNTKKRKRWKNPLPLFEFNGQYYIAAIFDTTLKNKISPGDICLSCKCLNDTTNIESQIKGFSSPKNSIKEMRKCKSGTLAVATQNSAGDTVTSIFEYNADNIVIPSNFIPRDSEFKQIKDIAYYKINKFENITYINFINNIEYIQNSKGLIFDLRNCGGGNSSIMSHILSHFIEHPAIIENVSLTGISEFKESIVLKPSQTVTIKVPVCILVNNRTICAAESFSYLMKKYSNAVLIGKAKTAGAFSTNHNLIFPDGFGVNIDCLTKNELYPNVNIEKKGISPDIWVMVTKVEDLYPYNDKILKTALKFLEYY